MYGSCPSEHGRIRKQEVFYLLSVPCPFLASTFLAFSQVRDASTFETVLSFLATFSSLLLWFFSCLSKRCIPIPSKYPVTALCLHVTCICVCSGWWCLPVLGGCCTLLEAAFWFINDNFFIYSCIIPCTKAVCCQTVLFQNLCQVHFLFHSQ